MKKVFLPDYFFKSFSDLSVDFLKKNSIEAIILDIDNTLVPYEIPRPTDELLSWFDELKKAGIKIAFVSNNNSERVNTFNEKLGFFATYKSKKPFNKCLKKAISAMGSTQSTTALMGDQIFTDIVAGNSLSLLTVLVPPIKDKTDAFTRFKRLMEKPIMKKFKKREKI